MGVSIEFSVNRTAPVAKVEARIHRANTPRDDIAYKYASLAARYFLQMRREMVIDDYPHIEDLTATINFTSGMHHEDESLFDHEMDDDYEDDAIDYVSDSLVSDYSDFDHSMAIGFDLRVSSVDTIGGSLSPAVVMATGVYQLLTQARNTVAL